MLKRAPILPLRLKYIKSLFGLRVYLRSNRYDSEQEMTRLHEIRRNCIEIKIVFNRINFIFFF